MKSIGDRLKIAITTLNSSAYAISKHTGISQSTVGNIVNGVGKKNNRTTLLSICNYLGISEDWLVNGVGEMILNHNKHDEGHKDFSTKKSNNNTFVRGVDSYVYESLPYISMKARASFVELGQMLGESGEVFRVIKTDPNESFINQIVIEIDGDSMEPVLFSGSKVRCKEIDKSDWVYLNSGVYAITYGNFFVVKRVKSSPSDGILTLHSDNLETGGSLNIPLNEVRKIWKVLRVVDAPVR